MFKTDEIYSYMRMKARKEVEEANREITRFDSDVGAMW